MQKYVNYFAKMRGSTERRAKSLRLIVALLVVIPGANGIGVAVAGQQTVLSPISYSVQRGNASNQGVGVLASENQRGDVDGWSEYLEFYSAGSGLLATMQFEAPIDFVGRTLENGELRVNFKGHNKDYQAWNFYARNQKTGDWVLVMDNSQVADWQWTVISAKLPGNAADYVDPLGRMQISLLSPKADDDVNIDSMQITLSAAETASTAAPPPQATEATPPASQVSSPATEVTAPVVSTSSPATVTTSPTQSGNIWQAKPGTSWQIQFTGNRDISLDVEMYDLDLFDTPTSVIDQLRNQGRVVICYFSGGTWENWRPDAGQFPDSVLGSNLADWPGERWLDVSNINALAPIMRARLDLAVEKGCNGVDPDNMDGYSNPTGFSNQRLNAADQLAYNKWLADEAHARGLAIGLKNDLEQVVQLEPYYDFAINESCNQYSECQLLEPFVNAGKAVFGIEYSGNKGAICSRMNALDFDFIFKSRSLDASREACR